MIIHSSIRHATTLGSVTHCGLLCWYHKSLGGFPTERLDAKRSLWMWFWRELRPIHRCWIQQCAVSGVQPFPRYITHFCSSMLHFCMDESCSIWSCNCLSLFSQWPSPKIKDMYSYSCLCLSPGLKAVLAEAEKTLRVTPDTTASGLAIYLLAEQLFWRCFVLPRCAGGS